MLDIDPFAASTDCGQDVVGSRLVEEPAQRSAERHSGFGLQRQHCCATARSAPGNLAAKTQTLGARDVLSPDEGRSGTPGEPQDIAWTQRELRPHDVDGTVKVSIGPHDRYHCAAVGRQRWRLGQGPHRIGQLVQ